MNTDNRGVLIVISGPSGAGKGTICKALLEKHKDLYFISFCNNKISKKW